MHFGTVPFWCEPNCAVSIIPAKVFKLEGAFQILTALHALLEKTCILVAKDGGSFHVKSTQSKADLFRF